MCSLVLFSDLILSAALWPWVRLGPEQNWVPGIFPGGKDGRCLGLKNLQPSCADCVVIVGTSTSWSAQGLSRLLTGLLYLTVFSSKQAGLHCRVTDWLGSNLDQDAGYPLRFSVLRFNCSTQMPLRVAYHKLAHDHTLALLFQSIIHWHRVIRRCTDWNTYSFVK